MINVASPFPYSYSFSSSGSHIGFGSCNSVISGHSPFLTSPSRWHSSTCWSLSKIRQVCEALIISVYCIVPSTCFESFSLSFYLSLSFLASFDWQLINLWLLFTHISHSLRSSAFCPASKEFSDSPNPFDCSQCVCSHLTDCHLWLTDSISRFPVSLRNCYEP